MDNIAEAQELIGKALTKLDLAMTKDCTNNAKPFIASAKSLLKLADKQIESSKSARKITKRLIIDSKR